MTDTQLYLTIGLPVFAVMMGMLVGVLQMNSMNGRFTTMDARITTLDSSLYSRIDRFEDAMNSRFNSLEARVETLMGKFVQIDNRLIRIEAILERH